MGTKYLLLWLEGPLQSWGVDSKFGRRESLRFPTKSGIYGIFLSSLGAQGPQVDLLKKLAGFKQFVISCLPRVSGQKDGIDVIGTPQSNPFLMDFQMVGSGYDEKDPWQKMLIPKKSDGSAAVGGGSKMTYRYYLQDATFVIIQELDSSLADSIANSMQNPVFDIYLGRKNCVPTDFVYRGTYDSFDEASAMAGTLMEDKNLEVSFTVAEEKGDGDQMVLNDVPVQFGQFKRYRDRTVTITKND
ncbi:MAG: type I-E CRISPR-associated protein Cas5/CasD [Sphaerochaeta sp.]|nr:type I-E CRISPR-associated protein Cas5/CasD [Sphaerochaeta sp.]